MKKNFVILLIFCLSLTLSPVFLQKNLVMAQSNSTDSQLNIPPPLIAIEQPRANALFFEGDTVNIRVYIADYPQPPVDRVEFYENETYLGTSTLPPYDFTWSDFKAGWSYLSAKLYYSNGSYATADRVLLRTLSHEPSILPAIIITSPENKMNYKEGDEIKVSAQAFDPDGTISKVEFFSGTQSLGFDRKAPYSIRTPPLQKGKQAIYAKAYDNEGNKNVSPLKIITTGIVEPSAIIISNPPDGSIHYKDTTVFISTQSPFMMGKFYANGSPITETKYLYYPFPHQFTETGIYGIHVVASDPSKKDHISLPNYILVKEFNQRNKLPIPDFEYETNGYFVTFESEGFDPDGFIDKTHWNFGDHTYSNETEPAHIYKKTGTYIIKLTITDNEGIAQSITKSITISGTE